MLSLLQFLVLAQNLQTWMNHLPMEDSKLSRGTSINAISIISISSIIMPKIFRLLCLIQLTVSRHLLEGMLGSGISSEPSYSRIFVTMKVALRKSRLPTKLTRSHPRYLSLITQIGCGTVKIWRCRIIASCRDVNVSVDAILRAKHALVPLKRGRILRLMDACMRRMGGWSILDILSSNAMIFVHFMTFDLLC